MIRDDAYLKTNTHSVTIVYCFVLFSPLFCVCGKLAYALQLTHPQNHLGQTRRLAYVGIKLQTPSIALRHLPPDSAIIGYAIEGALLISAQLSTDAVGALWKAVEAK